MSGKRIEWIDRLRGMAILLMLLGHALQFEGAPASYARAMDVIYLFHMPLFFVISGVLLGLRIAPGGAGLAKGKTIRKKLVALGIPYVVFSVAYIVFKLLLGDRVQTNAVVEGPGAVWKILWEPVGQYWFLEALFLFETTAVLLSDRPKAFTVLFPFLVLLCLANGSGLTAPLVRRASVFTGVFNNAFAFDGGILLAFWLRKKKNVGEAKKRLTAGEAAAILAVNAVFLIGALSFLRGDGEKSVGSALLRLVLCLAGILACAGVVCLLGRNDLAGRALSWLGQESWYIFLVHSYFLAASRAGMKLLGLHAPAAILAAEMLAGIAGPWLAHCVSKRVKWLDFFFYPARYIKLR